MFYCGQRESSNIAQLAGRLGRWPLMQSAIEVTGCKGRWPSHFWSYRDARAFGAIAMHALLELTRRTRFWRTRDAHAAHLRRRTLSALAVLAVLSRSRSARTRGARSTHAIKLRDASCDAHDAFSTHAVWLRHMKYAIDAICPNAHDIRNTWSMQCVPTLDDLTIYARLQRWTTYQFSPD
jgi:hypothetical protein